MYPNKELSPSSLLQALANSQLSLCASTNSVSIFMLLNKVLC